jgi:hypothetical protein
MVKNEKFQSYPNMLDVAQPFELMTNPFYCRGFSRVEHHRKPLDIYHTQFYFTILRVMQRKATVAHRFVVSLRLFSILTFIWQFMGLKSAKIWREVKKISYEKHK